MNHEEITKSDMRAARMRLAVNQQDFTKMAHYFRVAYSRMETGAAPVNGALYELALAWAEAPGAFERRKKEVGLE